MTLANNYVPLRQLGDNSTVEFSASWNMISAAYAVVLLQDAVTGVQTAVTQGGGSDQYEISVNSSGFVVTFGTAPTSTQYVIISRSTPTDQTNPYSTSRGFQGAVEEDSFDKLTAMMQETQQINTRAIIAPVGDTANLTMPTAPLRSNKFLAFDVNGNVIVASGSSAGTSISAAMTPVVQASTVAAALVLLGGAPLASPALTGTPTVPTAALNTRTTQVASTAFANPAASVTSSGYQKLPSGLIIQWGTTPTVNGSGGTSTITLPLTFPNNFWGVNTTRAVGGNTTIFDGAQILSASQFMLTNNGSINTAYYWFAFGN